MRPLLGRRRRLRDATIIGGVVAVLALGLVPGWGLPAEIFFVIIMAAELAILCYWLWQLGTGRVGLTHPAPTARRRRRLERQAAEEAQARAMIEQQRLEEALSHGPYPLQPIISPESEQEANARHRTARK